MRASSPEGLVCLPGGVLDEMIGHDLTLGNGTRFLSYHPHLELLPLFLTYVSAGSIIMKLITLFGLGAMGC